MDQFKDFFGNKKNLVNLIFLTLLVLGLPIGLKLARDQQLLRSRASIEPIVFSGSCVTQKGSKTVLICPDVMVQLTSPLGPPAITPQPTVCPADNETGGKDSGKKDKKDKKDKDKKDKDKKDKSPCPSLPPGAIPSNPPADSTPSASPSCAPDDKKCLKNQEKQDKKDGKDKNKDKDDESFLLNIIKNAYAGHLHESGALSDGEDGRFCDGNKLVKELATKNAEDIYVHELFRDCSETGEVCRGGSLGAAACELPSDSGSECSLVKPLYTECGGSSDCSPIGKHVYEVKEYNKETCGKFGRFSCTDLGEQPGQCGVPGESTSGFCNIGFQSPGLNSTQVSCLKTQRYCTPTCLLNSIVDNDPNKFRNCTDTQILNYWCNGGVTAGSTNPDCTLKKRECASSDPGTASNGGSGNSGNRGGRSGVGGSGGSRSGVGGNKDRKSASPSAAIQGNTVSFKMAESPDQLAQAPTQPYDMEPRLVPFTFSNPNPGIKTLFVEFISKSGSKERRTASITLVAPDPVITSVKCSLSSFGQGVSIDVIGEKLGSERGTLAIRDGGVDNLAKVTNWQDNSISAVVEFADELDVEGRSINLVITRKDGVFSEATCSVGESTILALGAKLFCRAPSSNSQAGVELGIVENTPGVKPIKQTVTIDKNGIIQDLDLRFSQDKQYQVSIQAPRSVRRNSKVFTPTDGTLQLLFQNNKEGGVNSNKLPVGDIFPLEGGDGRIDSQDARELFREWNSIKKGTSQLLGDFNLDGKVNAIDWACMRYDYGALEDPPLTTLNPSQSSSLTLTYEISCSDPYKWLNLSWNAVDSATGYDIYKNDVLYFPDHRTNVFSTPSGGHANNSSFFVKVKGVSNEVIAISNKVVVNIPTCQ